MADVIAFPGQPEAESEDIVYVCASCLCRSFVAHTDGRMECASCHVIALKAEGFEIPDELAIWEPREGSDTDSFNTIDIAYDHANLARESVKTKIGDDTGLLIVAREDGRVSVWPAGADDDETAEWFCKMMRNAARLLGLSFDGER